MNDTRPLGQCMTVCRALGSVFVSVFSAGISPNTHYHGTDLEIGDGADDRHHGAATGGPLDP